MKVHVIFLATLLTKDRQKAIEVVGVIAYFSVISLLWSPYVIGQTIIFLPCDFYLLFYFLA